MKIPKKIHLTCKDKNNIDNIIWKECLENYKLIYPDYEIIIYDNEDIYKIIENNFPEYLEKIKQIKIGAIVADIFRYLILKGLKNFLPRRGAFLFAFSKERCTYFRHKARGSLKK